MIKGSEIGLKIDQTLTQDATGTMAYLEFETMGIDRIKTELSVAYVDHNTLQSGYMNADDHRFIQSMAKKYGLKFSRPGNGICHQVHLERFGVPGKTLIGSDSHTPTAGGMGMLAMGAGGMDVACAMGGGAYYINMPGIIRVELKGKLSPFVTAKDISLELLRRLTVKGGVGYIIEWAGEGIRNLSVPERATITNMGAELGATSSLFPSDEVTKAFLEAQRRGNEWRPLEADPDAEYDKTVVIDLDMLEPMAACPHSPDNVCKVSEAAGLKVDQVCIGSCTNSSLSDMLKVAAILKGNNVSPDVNLSISPGSRQVLAMLSYCGALSDMIDAGARILECACGPCIGMGFSPNSGGVSLRTFNRNFEGRSGTADASVYLVSPETAAASAIKGVLTDPRDLDIRPDIRMPEKFRIDDGGIIEPAAPEDAGNVEILRGPNIKPFPDPEPVGNEIKGGVSLKAGNNITTDHIMPAGSKILPYRSNIPYMSKFCFEAYDKEFPERARMMKQSVIVAGENYGQGSSREHAALVPLYLGVRAVIAKSFARIHAANLINAGILPLVFEDPADYDLIYERDLVILKDVHKGMESGRITLYNVPKQKEISLIADFTERQKGILKAGGLLKYVGTGNK